MKKGGGYLLQHHAGYCLFLRSNNDGTLLEDANKEKTNNWLQSERLQSPSEVDLINRFLTGSISNENNLRKPK